jgi:hypothetical protein
MQSTRPQTLGYSLADSLVGMLAWIYEKLVQWTDSYPWTDEEGVSPYLTLSVAQSSHFVLTLVSIDLDINLLVFACGTSSIGEDLLRDSRIKRLLGLAPPASNRASWHIFLPKGIGPITSSVGLSLSSCIVLLINIQFEMLCRFLRAESNVVFESEHDVGGHFAAYEQPEALVDDLKRMFGKGGPAAGVVPRHDGF